MRAAKISLFAFALSAVPAQEPVSFHKQIRPILVRQCQGCHQPASQQSGLSLIDYAAFRAGGRKGPSFVPGDPDTSVVIWYLTGQAKPQMPFGGKPLAEEQIDLFRRWVREGARDDSPAGASIDAAAAAATVYYSPPVVTALAVSPDGRTLAVSGHREILLHKFEGGLIARLPGLSDRIHSLVFSPDGATLAAVGGSPARFGEVQIWDLAARKQKHSLVLTSDTLFGASLSPDAATLVVGASDKTVRMIDVASGKEIRKIDHHEDWVFGSIFGANGRRFVTVSRDRAAKLTDASNGSFIENVNLLKEPLTAIARHPKRDWILIGGEERVPYLYTLDRPRAMRIADDSTLLRRFDKQDGPILALAISADGKYGAVGSAYGDVRIYDLGTGAEAAKCSGHSGGIYALQFHPDGRLAAAGFDGYIRIYDVAGKLAHSFVPVNLEKAVVAREAKP